MILPLPAVLRLTVAFAGIQFAWAVELAYGSPFLISLGMSKSTVALVWLAGPLSGLLIQPIVGSISDSCTSPHGKRRPFIWGEHIFTITVVNIVVFSLLLLFLLGCRHIVILWKMPTLKSLI